MISFYPGPSRIHDQIPLYVKDAAKLGIMSMNHRSEEFISLSKKTIGLLKQKLAIPRDYTILFTSSATECWEIIAQSLITDKSYHLFSGAFGKKWFEYTLAINRNAEGILFSREEYLNPVDFLFPHRQALICLTQNETSNGTQIDSLLLKKFRQHNPDALLAIDATSSMAGIKLDFKQADVWFASVQKCFGLPAGLALMVCSPRAIRQAKITNERLHYNSLTSMIAMMEKWQTTHTPNVLGIYLLMRVLEKSKTIRDVHAQTLKRFQDWQAFFEDSIKLKLLVDTKKVRSLTVLPIVADEKTIAHIKTKAKNAGFLLGEGYGDLKTTTFRIANFPALRDKEINAFRKFLKTLEKI